MEERRKTCRLTAAALLLVLLVARSASGRPYCNQHQCGGDDLCIPLAYVCDDEQDCADNSDELGCDPKLCQGPDEFHCFDGHHCIPLRWTCDGQQDCRDGSDEHTCPDITCDTDHVSCGAHLPCIHSSFLCDGHVDCPGGYDERNSTCASKPCDEDEFRCATGHQCISQRWICDGDSDCHDGSDERNCPPVTCPPNQYHCPRSGECIPSAWLCDESYDCEDRSDEEQGCVWTVTEAPQCPADELACTRSGECLHASWRCDGDKDCADGTDEVDCAPLTCNETTQFQCRTAGNCISAARRCDGIRQCDDASDEVDCFNARCDPVTEFDCSAATGQPISSRASRNCIPIAQVCDGRNSCGNNEDEAEAICANRTNPCLVNKGGCEHVCVQGLRAAFCRCHEGYELREDGKSCADIDECSVEVLTGIAGVEPSRGRCSQLCDNTRGGYKCRCKLGYDLDPINRTTCYARGSEPFLLFASRHDVREFRVRSQHYRPLVEGLRGARALTLAGLQGIGARRTLFWSDVANITRVVLSLNASTGSSLSASSPAHEVVVSGVKAADGLAYDWVHDNLYWTDGSRGRIEVMSGAALTQISANGRWRKTVVDKLDEPKAIVLDPRDDKRYMYWTECGRTPQILRASLDGSAIDVVVATSTNVVLPLGLTIDYETDSLLWVDAKLHSIFSVDLVTRRSHIIFVSHIYLRHPFALSVFEDTVYWADSNTNSIYKRSKFHTTAVASAAGAALNNVTKVAQLLSPPTDLHVYHALRQPFGSNACENKRCSHLCLPKAAFPGFVCACPDPASELLGAPRLTLDARGLTCVPSSSDLRPVSTPPAVPPMRGAGTSLPSTAAPLNALAGGSGTTEGAQGGAPISWIVVGVVIFVLVVVLALLGLLVRRRYQRKNRKTMNFDNPLYRKRAGDDQFSLQNNMRPADNRISAHPLTEPLNFQTNECFVAVEGKE